MTGRWPTTLLAALGGLAAGIGGTVAEAPAVAGLGWAVLAGTALSLMLHGVGLRVLGVVLVLLGVLGGVLSVLGTAWLATAFVPVLAGGVLMAMFGPGWAAGRKARPPSEDPWKLLDQGEDPTI
ncbi:MAG: hypothetical protein GX596_07345 [Propionibacterium sp.]|nr:hypothetical protein [Propionibacterium sp.]